MPGKVVISAAVVGAEVMRDRSPAVPYLPAEIARAAVDAWRAGASVVHLHARWPDGRPSQEAAHFREIIDRLRAAGCDAIVQCSTGGAVGMSIDERAQPLDCKPEMATLNCGTLNFGDDVFVNTRPDIRKIAAEIRAAGAVPELECYEVGHVAEALALASEGAIERPLHFQFVLGVPGAIPAREDVVAYMRTLVPAGSTWGVAAIGRWQQPMTELAMRLGGHARVGIEDNIYLSKGVLSEGSAPLVARAAAFARSIGREVVDTARARTLLGVGGPAAS
jgi:3-keto-5-aminohexanoate cleavage enzyme